MKYVVLTTAKLKGHVQLFSDILLFLCLIYLQVSYLDKIASGMAAYFIQHAILGTTAIIAMLLKKTIWLNILVG